MKNFNKTLIIELYNCSSIELSEECERIKRKHHRCNNGEKLEQILSKHIEKRGFGDYAVIKTVETKSEKKINCFAIIANKIIHDLHSNNLLSIIDEEIDKIIYNALQSAKRDVSIQQYAQI